MLQNIPNQHRLDFSTRRDLKTLQCQKSNVKKSNCVCVCVWVSQSESGSSQLALIQECSGPEDKSSHLGKCCGPVCVCVCADTSPELSRWDTQVWQLQPQWFVCENRLYPHLCVLIWICPLQCWRPVYIWMCVCVCFCIMSSRVVYLICVYIIKVCYVISIMSFCN